MELAGGLDGRAFGDQFAVVATKFDFVVRMPNEVVVNPTRDIFAILTVNIEAEASVQIPIIEKIGIEAVPRGSVMIVERDPKKLFNGRHYGFYLRGVADAYSVRARHCAPLRPENLKIVA